MCKDLRTSSLLCKRKLENHLELSFMCHKAWTCYQIKWEQTVHAKRERANIFCPLFFKIWIVWRGGHRAECCGQSVGKRRGNAHQRDDKVMNSSANRRGSGEGTGRTVHWAEQYYIYQKKKKNHKVKEEEKKLWLWDFAKRQLLVIKAIPAEHRYESQLEKIH